MRHFAEYGRWREARYFGGGTKTRTVEVERPAPPTPKEEDKAVQEAAAEAIRKKRTQRGYRATILRDMSTLEPEQQKKLETLGT
jgi:hypothetical protein